MIKQINIDKGEKTWGDMAKSEMKQKDKDARIKKK